MFTCRYVYAYVYLYICMNICIFTYLLFSFAYLLFYWKIWPWARRDYANAASKWHIHRYILNHIHTSIQIHIRKQTCAHAYTCIFTYLCFLWKILSWARRDSAKVASKWYIHTNIRTHTYIRIQIHIYIYMCTCIYIYILLVFLNNNVTSAPWLCQGGLQMCSFFRAFPYFATCMCVCVCVFVCLQERESVCA